MNLVQNLREKVAKAKELVENVSSLELIGSTSLPVRLVGAGRKFSQVKREVISKFSNSVKLELDGNDIVITGSYNKGVETILKKYGKVVVGE